MTHYFNLSRTYCANVSLFLLLFSTLFAKVIIFQFACFEYVAVRLVFKQPLLFGAFWAGKIVMPLIIAAPTLITTRNYWTISVNCLVDIWAIVNMIYFNSNGTMITYDMIFMLDNLSGFGSSLLTYMNFSQLLMPIITLLYVIAISSLHLWKTAQSNIKVIVMTLVVTWGIGMHITANVLTNYVNGCPLSMSIYQYCTQRTSMTAENRFVYQHSFISWLPTLFIYHHINRYYGTNYVLSEQDEQRLNALVHQRNQSFPQKNLILILVESLESWPLQEICGVEYAPFLRKFTTHEQVMYCEHIRSQVKHGVSGDGQMIISSGILPISDGVACKKYGNNTFPNYAHFYTNSAIVNPMPNVWNQKQMTNSYHYQELIEPTSNNETWEDETIFEKMADWIRKQNGLFCCMGITISTHAPFKYGNEHPYHAIQNMPSVLQDYLSSIHYTDSCIGTFIVNLQEDGYLNNTIIVITGDHNLFRNKTHFKEITDYALNNGIDMQAGETYTPLIVYSSDSHKNRVVEDTCYQMDIFPTILHMIGCDNYYWQGFGVNLADTNAQYNRFITETEAYNLSELVLKSDFFATVEK